MAWIPSHQELRDHPKTRRAARLAGVPVPAIIGHLHLLWHWTLDHAPDGDLSRFDPEDLADAAMWEGDPAALVDALTECGPGDSAGFLNADLTLHDWDEFGGKYGRRVDAAKKAAAARWKSDGNATAMRPHDQPQSNGNADKRRVDKKEIVRPKRGTRAPDLMPVTDAMRKWATDNQVRHNALAGETDKFLDYHRAKGTVHKDWHAAWRNWMRNAKGYRPEIVATVPSDDHGPQETYR